MLSKRGILIRWLATRLDRMESTVCDWNVCSTYLWMTLMDKINFDEIYSDAIIYSSSRCDSERLLKRSPYN